MSDKKDNHYTTEELVKIGDHIHFCDSCIILVNTVEKKGTPEQGNNVLFSTKGNQHEVATLLLEVMLKEPHFVKIVEMAFIGYAHHTSKLKKEN